MQASKSIGANYGYRLAEEAGKLKEQRESGAAYSLLDRAACSGVGYTNVQAIKNRMSRYDKDGDYISPVMGLAGLVITEKNRAEKNRIIDIPESSREYIKAV